MDVKRLWNNESQLKSITGLSKREAEILYDDFSALLQKKEEKKKIFGGRPNKLPMLDFFVMLMYHIRYYPTYSALGAMFGLDTSNAERRIQEFLELLQKILKTRGLILLGSEKDDILLLKAASITMNLCLLMGLANQ